MEAGLKSLLLLALFKQTRDLQTRDKFVQRIIHSEIKLSSGRFFFFFSNTGRHCLASKQLKKKNKVGYGRCESWGKRGAGLKPGTRFQRQALRNKRVLRSKSFSRIKDTPRVQKCIGVKGSRVENSFHVSQDPGSQTLIPALQLRGRQSTSKTMSYILEFCFNKILHFRQEKKRNKKNEIFISEVNIIASFT